MPNKDNREGWLRVLKKGLNDIICTDTSENFRSIKRIMPTGRIITIGLVDCFKEDKSDSQGNIIGDKHHPRNLEQATKEYVLRINAGNFSRID